MIKKKWALVLSGGGANGAAHIPILKFLEENNLKPNLIVGTSVGAILGGLWALGTPANQLKKHIFELKTLNLIDIHSFNQKHHRLSSQIKFRNLFSLITFGLYLHRRLGLVKGNNIEELLERLTNNKMIEDSNIPFCCNAVSLGKGEEVVFNSGKMANAMRASMSIPGIFKPTPYEDDWLVDGGLLANVPLHLARAQGFKRILAVNVTGKEFKTKKLNNIFDVMSRAINIQVNSSGNLSLEKDPSVLSLNPVINDIFFDFSKTSQAYQESEAYLADKKKMLLTFLS